ILCCVRFLSTVRRLKLYRLPRRSRLFFFFNDTATTEIYTLSLHDALPIYAAGMQRLQGAELFGHHQRRVIGQHHPARTDPDPARSEEHTSELQSRENLVCRLLLEKKKHTTQNEPVSRSAESINLSSELRTR